MGSNDFGWFLMFIGAVWISFSIPLDQTLFTNELILPLGLIIFGLMNVMIGFINKPNLKHLIGLAFMVFIILMFRTNVFSFNWVMPWNFGRIEMTEHYDNSINAELIELKLSCDICSLKINSSQGNNLDTVINYNENSEVKESVSDELIMIDLSSNNNPFSGGEVIHSLPINPGVTSLDVGVGSIKFNFTGINEVNKQLTITSGVGSIELHDLGLSYDLITVSSGTGSIDVWIIELNGSKVINLDAGVGSINVYLKQGLEFKLEADTGIGSINNDYDTTQSSGYGEAVNKVLLKVNTGVGSVNIRNS